MLSLSFASDGQLTQMFERRIKACSGRSIEMGIHTPDDIAWWYYNEFGTATQATGPVRRTGRYRIVPRPPNRYLIFPWNGELVAFTSVLHPGTKASHFTLLASKEYRKAIRRAFHEAVRSGGTDDMQKIRESLLHSMQLAKEAIAESMSRLLQQEQYHDEGHGKLKGRKAHEVYLERAQVVDQST